MEKLLLTTLISTAAKLGCDKILKFLSCELALRISKCQTLQEMREFLEQENDFTPEQWQQVMKENAWCTEALT